MFTNADETKFAKKYLTDIKAAWNLISEGTHGGCSANVDLHKSLCLMHHMMLHIAQIVWPG